MLNWKCAHTYVKVCTCSCESVHMLNWKCTCSTGSVPILNWKHAQGWLEAYAGSTESIYMLGGGSQKKNFNIFFSHKLHIGFRQLRKVWNSRAIHTQDVKIHRHTKLNRGFGKFTGVKNQFWNHFFCRFFWRFQISCVWKHLRLYAQLKVCVCSIESVQHQKKVQWNAFIINVHRVLIIEISCIESFTQKI